MSFTCYKTCRSCLDLCEDNKSLKETLKFEDEIIEIVDIVKICVGLKVIFPPNVNEIFDLKFNSKCFN